MLHWIGICTHFTHVYLVPLLLVYHPRHEKLAAVRQDLRQQRLLYNTTQSQLCTTGHGVILEWHADWHWEFLWYWHGMNRDWSRALRVPAICPVHINKLQWWVAFLFAVTCHAGTQSSSISSYKQEVYLYWHGRHTDRNCKLGSNDMGIDALNLCLLLTDMAYIHNNRLTLWSLWYCLGIHTG